MQSTLFLSLLWSLVVSFTSTVSAIECSATAFRSILPQNSTVVLIGDIEEGGTFGDAHNLNFPGNATGLPRLCAVQIQVRGHGAPFMFGLFLPQDWNHRLIGTGNTGFGGGINYPAMGRLVHYGSVAFSTDTGHSSGPGNATWALKNDDALINWGERAMHESIVAAKAVVHDYYSDQISYSYYMACSGGGRQGFKEAQEFPDDFDGYAIGHPPWLLTHLHPWAAYVGVVNLPNTSASHIPEDILGNLTQRVTDICDPQDGVTDNIVMTPWTCDFDSSQLLCQNSTEQYCLTPEQKPTFDAIWSDWKDQNGTVISPSLMFGGDISVLAGTDAGEPSEFGLQMVDNMIVNDTNWDFMSLTPEIVNLGDSLDPGSSNADNFDLTPLRSAGGKIIHYHGLADTLIPPAYSIYYYKQVQSLLSRSNIDVTDFYRLFLIPGLHHCSGSAGAPFFIAGGGQATKEDNYTHSVPGFMDSKHDIVLAVMDWVENGTAPDSIIATKWHSDRVSEGLSKQMPLCPYPQVAQHQKGTNLAEADHWTCGDGPEYPLENIPIARVGSVKVNGSSTTGEGPGPTPKSEGSSLLVSSRSYGLAGLVAVGCLFLRL